MAATFGNCAAPAVLRARLYNVLVLTSAVIFIAAPQWAVAQGQAAKPKTPIVAERKWQVLFLGKPMRNKSITPLENYPVIDSQDLEFVGPRPGDAFQLGKFRVDGEWGVQSGNLVRFAGKNAAVVLGEAEDFELEGRINAEGVGGWFWLLGYKDGNGYGLYNVTFRQSGSPWFITEFDKREALDAGEELHKYNWKGEQPFWMSVVNGRLNLKVGNQTAVIRNQPLPNYQRGQIILGTYDTRYGPKDVKVRSLRLRVPPKK